MKINYICFRIPLSTTGSVIIYQEKKLSRGGVTCWRALIGGSHLQSSRSPYLPGIAVVAIPSEDCWQKKALADTFVTSQNRQTDEEKLILAQPEALLTHSSCGPL